MRGLERRLARLEAAREARDEALVSPETFLRMAAVDDAERARIREKLLGVRPPDGVATPLGVESEARARLRQKLLRDDVPTAGPAA